jgi:prepilin-type N-terminal cleavage/methylation domain-containing protein
MGKATHELRRRGADQRGMTLVELMVATMILGIVMIVVSSVFASIERSIVLQNNLSTTLDQGRLALEQLDRELRSGNVLYDPATENAGTTSCSGCVAGYTLRIYTQSNASSSAGYRCELWKIDTSEQLLVRTWAPDDPTGPSTTAWRSVRPGPRHAEGVTNREHHPVDEQRLFPSSEPDGDPSGGAHRARHVVRVPEQRVLGCSKWLGGRRC